MSLTGHQYQYTGYSINLAGGRITLLAMEFPPLNLSTYNLYETCLVATSITTHH